MQELRSAFITKHFLRSIWARDFESFKGSDEERLLLRRLELWSERKDLKETSAEAAFIEEFFHETWSYVQIGQAGSEKTFTLWPTRQQLDCAKTCLIAKERCSVSRQLNDNPLGSLLSTRPLSQRQSVGHHVGQGDHGEKRNPCPARTIGRVMHGPDDRSKAKRWSASSQSGICSRV